MSRKQKEEGQLEYTGRALQQDAHQAMRGDIVRGLIELITNADDAYRGADGKIRVEVEHRRAKDWQVIVKDRAGGMTRQEMREKICKIAGRTSGFERGEAVRGQLGRGVKDLVAFGPVTFESVKDDRYARMQLQPDGTYTLEDADATQDHRERVGLKRGSGMVVTVTASSQIRCPQHSRLAEQLAKHFQLRGIMSDERREVLLVNLNDEQSQVLRYSFPDLPVVFDEKISIAGYPAAKAKLTIYRNPERYEESSTDPCRPAGILVKGARAIYENTLFSFENRPQAGWFSGHVECEYIDQLARDFDDRGGRERDPSNPIPIVTRTRDGLAEAHPFYKALKAAVEAPLGKLVDAEERTAREAGARESSDLRRCLDALGKDLTRLMTEDLREIDEELEPGDQVDQVAPVQMVPEQVVLYMGEDRTLTVRVRADLGATSIVVKPDPEGVIELVDGELVELKPHPRRPELLVGRIRVRPLLEGKQTLLSASVGDFTNHALLEVEPERDEQEVEILPPDGLQFERESYRVAWGKKDRMLRIVAPVEVVAEEGQAIRVTSSDRGVVVLDGGRAELRRDDNLGYFVAQVRIDPRTLGAKATLVAEVGQLRAAATVVVAQDDDGPRLDIKVRDQEAGTRRALVERTEKRTIISIMGQHPAVRRYFGPGPSFSFQDMSASRAIIAEIVAGEATRMVMEKKYPTGGAATTLDAAALYADHSKYLAKYLGRCHKMLVPDAALKTSAA